MQNNKKDNPFYINGDIDDQFLIKQGAEARIYLTTILGKNVIVKERFLKEYRHPFLDKKITKQRVQSESKILTKCKELNIDVPIVLNTDPKKFHRIVMEFIEGCSVKEFLKSNNPKPEDVQAVAQKIGQIVATLHNNNIIHGDLTTSNMILRDNDISKLVMIDFGLSYSSKNVEDKGVDLYVLERAILSTHPDSDVLVHPFPFFFVTFFQTCNDFYFNHQQLFPFKQFDGIMKAYKENVTNSDQILQRFEKSLQLLFNFFPFFTYTNRFKQF